MTLLISFHQMKGLVEDWSTSQMEYVGAPTPLETREPAAFHDRKRLRARRRMSGPMGEVGECTRDDMLWYGPETVR